MMTGAATQPPNLGLDMEYVTLLASSVCLSGGDSDVRVFYVCYGKIHDAGAVFAIWGTRGSGVTAGEQL